MNNQNSLNVTSWVANKGCNIFNNIHSDSQRVRKKDCVYNLPNSSECYWLGSFAGRRNKMKKLQIKTKREKPILDPIKHIYTFPSDGNIISGATTILKNISAPALIPWAANMAVNHILDNSTYDSTNGIYFC